MSELDAKWKAVSAEPGWEEGNSFRDCARAVLDKSSIHQQGLLRENVGRLKTLRGLGDAMAVEILAKLGIALEREWPEKEAGGE